MTTLIAYTSKTTRHTKWGSTIWSEKKYCHRRCSRKFKPFVHDSTLVRRAYFGGSPVTNDIEDQTRKSSFKVYQNYPNPFNPSTKIRFYLPEAGFVSIEIYSLTGVKVAQIAHINYNSGNHTVNYDASHLSSGVY